MEANKENINKCKNITRIPLPLNPLPAIPKHVVEGKSMNYRKEVQERQPLKTITQSNSASQPHFTLPGSSKNLNNNVSNAKHKHSLKIDTIYVTETQKDEVDKKDDIILIISDDEEEDDIENDSEKKRKSHESRTAVTTALRSTLEPSRVRNIKKPHSQELQGLSPVNKKQIKGDEHVRRPLCFTESVDEKLISQDFLYMFDVERKGTVPRLSTQMRACVINWLMRVNTADGNPATAQAACWFLDCVLSAGRLQVDKLQLIAATCYWIAQKMHAPRLNAAQLIKASDHAFTTEELLAAEESVLERLEFPRHPIAPQKYITYLSWWCDNYHPGEIEVAATFLTMCFMMADKRYCNDYPSVIAAAAVKNALVLLRKVDLMIRLQACPVFKMAEKKAESLSQTCSLIRRSACAVSSTSYEYKTPIEHYNGPPHFIAERVIHAASETIILDASTSASLH